MNKNNSITRFLTDLLTGDDAAPQQVKVLEPEAPQGYFQNPFKRLGKVGWLVVCYVAVCACLFGDMNTTYALIGTGLTLLTVAIAPRLLKVVGIPVIIFAALLATGVGADHNVSRLGFISLALVFLLRMIYKPSSNAERIVSLVVMVAIVIACFFTNIPYFVFMVMFVSVAMFLCNIYRRQVIHYWIAMSVTSVMMISAVFFLGRSAEERRAEQRAELALPYNMQHRLDRWKDAIFTRSYDSTTQTNSYISFEHQISGTIKEHIGMVPSILLVLLVFVCLFSFVVSVQSCPANYRVMPFLCLLALLTDALYYVTTNQGSAPAASFFSHSIMIGIILSFVPKEMRVLKDKRG